MNARQSGRLWLIGGVLAIIILVVSTYLLAIKPVYEETAAKQAQTLDAETDLRRLSKKLSELQDQVKKKKDFEQQLADKEAQLPDNYDIPALLEQLQTSDKSVSVKSNSIGISTPVKLDGTATVVGLPITMTVTGKVGALTKFVNRIQNVQSRAVLITSVTLNVAESDAQSTINAMMTAYCSKSDDDDCQVASA